MHSALLDIQSATLLRPVNNQANQQLVFLSIGVTIYEN